MNRHAAGFVVALAVVAAGSAAVSAHVGSPDVFFEGAAGPYRLLVAIRTPVVVPGVAGIEVRVLEGNAREVHVVPMRLTGPGADFAPVPDLASRSADDPRFYTASLWMMTSGPWKVRVTVDGDGGRHDLAIPVDAVASRTLEMPASLRLVLAPLGLFLVLGFIAIVGASAGQAQVTPGTAMPAHRRRRALVSRVIAAGVVALVLFGGNAWWGVEADAYARYIYKPLDVRAALQDSTLTLTLHDPGWLPTRVSDDLVPDHGHPMHLFLVREPALDRLLHLHPRQIDTGVFRQTLPSATAGRYRLFADIVHSTGFPETMVTTLDVPAALTGGPSGDDSVADAAVRAESADTSPLPDGGRMVWEREAGPTRASRPYILTFKVDDASGQPARDLELYMGMPGHAIVMKRDLSVFAHVHPSGTAPMASIALAARGIASDASPHAQHAMASALPATVTFPYGFPSAGDYRVFVQVKRAGAVQTGFFDVTVQ
jgi:hypothetical protein